MRHSPGPWREDYYQSDMNQLTWCIRDAQDRTVVYGNPYCGEPLDDNGKLLAAAPEMYRILCQICNQDQNWGVVFQGPIVDARTLLKKLEGEQ